MDNKALSHLRVIDLTHYKAGPYCTKLMAGFGAEVIKIEHPDGGDKLRRSGPFFRDDEGHETGIPFLWLNTGKKSVTLNLKTDRGKDILKSLVRDADILVENFSPRVMPALGLSYEALQEVNPGLIMASISNFGQSGPYRDYKTDEIGAQAMSGIMHMTGDPGRFPLAAGPDVCQSSAGMHAYTAILMALFQRTREGFGQYIDISIMECALEHIELSLSNFLSTAKVPKRGGHIMALWDIYPCEDGYAVVISAPVRHWKKGAEIFEEPRLFDEKYGTALERSRRRRELDDLIAPWLAGHKKKDIFRMGQENGLAFGYLSNFDEVISSPQHKSRMFFKEVYHPLTGKQAYCDAPFKMSQTPWEIVRAPLLGEHNDDIYGALCGFSPREIGSLKSEGVI